MTHARPTDWNALALPALFDALARQKLAARRMPRARTFGAAERRLGGFCAQLLHQALHCSSIALKALGGSTYL